MTTEAGQLGTLGASISHEYSSLASDSAGAIKQTSNAEVANRLKSRLVWISVVMSLLFSSFMK